MIGRLGFGGVALHGIGPTDLEMRECTDGQVQHNPPVVEYFLELGGCFAPFMCRQIGFSSRIDRIDRIDRIQKLNCKKPVSIIQGQMSSRGSPPQETRLRMPNEHTACPAFSG